MTEMLDTSRLGCPAGLAGQHYIEWIDVPAQTWVFDSHRNVPAHRRGICLECDQTFMEEVKPAAIQSK